MNVEDPKTQTEGFEECKKDVDHEQFTADADRYMVQTKAGIIDDEKVAQYRESHAEAMKENNASVDPPAGVNGISYNQTQEYFAIATETGFEILQNDSGSSRLKKKVQELNKNIALVEMMYKTNVIVLVYEQ